MYHFPHSVYLHIFFPSLCSNPFSSIFTQMPSNASSSYVWTLFCLSSRSKNGALLHLITPFFNASRCITRQKQEHPIPQARPHSWGGKSAFDHQQHPGCTTQSRSPCDRRKHPKLHLPHPGLHPPAYAPKSTAIHIRCGFVHWKTSAGCLHHHHHPPLGRPPTTERVARVYKPKPGAAGPAGTLCFRCILPKPGRSTARTLLCYFVPASEPRRNRT